MTAAAALIQRIREGAYDALFARLYGESRVEAQRDRYCEAAAAFTDTCLLYTS